MGMPAILVMWPGRFEQTFVPPSRRGAVWNLTLIGQAVSEEKMFKECGRQTTEAYLPYKLTSELSAQVTFFEAVSESYNAYQKAPNGENPLVKD